MPGSSVSKCFTGRRSASARICRQRSLQVDLTASIANRSTDTRESWYAATTERESGRELRLGHCAAGISNRVGFENRLKVMLERVADSGLAPFWTLSENLTKASTSSPKPCRSRCSTRWRSSWRNSASSRSNQAMRALSGSSTGSTSGVTPRANTENSTVDGNPPPNRSSRISRYDSSIGGLIGGFDTELGKHLSSRQSRPRYHHVGYP